MNKRFVFGAVAALSLAGMASARPVDLALWTFENSVPATAGPHTAEGGVFALTSQASGTTGGTYSNPVGNGSFESFSSNGWNTGEYYQFSTSTTGYQNISITWDQTRSGTGPATFDLAVSINGGAFSTLMDNYTVLTNDAAGGGPWTSGGSRLPVYTFSNIGGTGTDGVASLVFRLISQVDGATAGTNRVDNVQVSGDLIPTPGTLALVGVAGLVGIRRRRA